MRLPAPAKASAFGTSAGFASSWKIWSKPPRRKLTEKRGSFVALSTAWTASSRTFQSTQMPWSFFSSAIASVRMPQSWRGRTRRPMQPLP